MVEPHKWKTQRYADVGTSEPFLVRIVVGLPEILGGTKFGDKNKDAIQTAIVDIGSDCLTQAFMALLEFRKAANDPDAAILSKTKPFDDMCKWLWTAYKDRMVTATKLMGYDIGFLFQDDKKFEKGCTAFSANHPEVHAELIERMKLYRTGWQNLLCDFRNEFLEHRSKASNSYAGFYSLKNAEVLFENVWTAIEDILILLMEPKVPVGFAIREIPEAERTPAMPKKYGWAWAQSTAPPTSDVKQET